MDRLTNGNDNVFRLRFFQKTPEGRVPVDLTLMRDIAVTVKDFWGKVVTTDWELDAEENNAILLEKSYLNKASCHHTVEVTMENINDHKHHRFAKKCVFGTVDWGNDAYVTFERYGEADNADLDIDFEVVMTAVTSDKTLVTQLQDMLDTATEQEAERQAAEGQRQQTFEDNESTRQATFDAAEAERAAQFEGDEDVWDRKIQEKLDEIITLEFDAVPKNASNKAVKSNGIFDTFAELNEALSTEVTGYTVYNYNLQDTGRFGTSTSYHHAAIPVSAGDQYLIKRSGSNVIRYAYCTSNNYTSGGFIPMVSDTDVMRLDNDGDEVAITIPFGCSYLAFNAGSPYQVNVWKFREKLKNVVELSSDQGVLTQEQYDLVMGDHCVIKYSGRYYYKTKTTSGGCEYWSVDTTNTDTTIQKWGIDIQIGRTYQELTLMDGRPRVFANPGNTTSTLSSIKIGNTSYSVASQDTHRPIQMNGTEILGNNTTPLNLKAGSNVTLTNSGGEVTISSTGGGGGGSTDWGDITNKPNFATVATSGSYNDLSNKPTIPAAQVNADWNASTGVAQILNKPTIPDVTGKADKVQSATNGHLAGLNASGNLTDSGIVPSTLVYQGPATGSASSVDFDPETDTVHVTSQTLSSSQKTQARTNIGAQEALTTQTAYTTKGSATKVPQITTNTLGQVTGITEVTITQPDISNCVQKSNTSGLLKNDGTVDTSTYVTASTAPVTSVNSQTGAVVLSIPDVSTKADKVVVVDASTLPASLDPNKVYQFGTLTGSVTIPAFASVAAGDTEAKIWCMTFSTSTTAPTITWPAGITAWSGGSTPTINASKNYEVSVMDGIGVIIEA